MNVRTIVVIFTSLNRCNHWLYLCQRCIGVKVESVQMTDQSHVGVFEELSRRFR